MANKTDRKQGKVTGLALSDRRGTRKKSVDKANFIKDEGIEGDAHRNYYRQVSVLSKEERDRIATHQLHPGDAAENVLIEGIADFSKITEGSEIMLGCGVKLEVIQVGKEVTRSIIHEYTGKPVLPIVGVFCTVKAGGEAAVGDELKIILMRKKQ